MIIGIDASRANHQERTGVEEYSFQIIQHLKKITPDNIRVVLYTDKPLQGELANLPENWSVKVLDWPPRRFWTQIRLSWEMLTNSPDVLFIPAHVFPIIHPRKTVMTIHDIAAVKFPESYSWFERWYTLCSSKQAVKKLWKVIVPSEFTKQELISNFQFPISNKIAVISHGYDREKFKLKTGDYSPLAPPGREGNFSTLLNKYKITQPFIISIGRLEEKKNTVKIIKSFENLKIVLKLKIKNLKLVLVGKPGFGYEKVKEAISNSQFKTDIVVPGWVDEEDLPKLLHTAEVFVFPSLYEGFGLPILEAFACGVPVVASKGNSLEEVGGDACEYVDAMNVEEISEAINKLLQNADFRMQNVKNGLERVKEFSWEKCAEETMKILLN